MLCWLPQSTGTLPAGTPPYLREIFARLHASGSSASKELIVAIANKPVTPELSDSAVDGVAKAMATISSFVVDEPLACSLAKIRVNTAACPRAAC